MRYLTIGLLVLAMGCGTQAPPRAVVRGPETAEGRPAVANDAVSNLNHPVSTRSALAQRHFNDGLTLVYAFNHDAAVRSFRRALEADPNLAMAHWGIALAVGPNYNVNVDAEREKQGYDAIQKAIELSKEAPEPEKAYIAAMAKRFSNADKPDLIKLAHDYADAMRDLSVRYPDDLDAATLYADAMMNLRPWKLWSKDYQPAEGTEQIVTALQSVLARDPDHIGANHLFIHAIEASKHPEQALESAARLPTLAPSCGHLVHMPSHIYARVGDHESASTSNEAAVAADREFFAKNPDMTAGIYNMMYYSHNMHFLAYAEELQGSYAAAMQWAGQLAEHVRPHVAHMQMLEAFMTVPDAVRVRCRKWDDVLAAPGPDEKAMPITTAIWHFSRGMAFAARGEVARAGQERAAMVAIKAKLPPDTPFAMLNKADHVLAIAQDTLDAKIAAGRREWSTAQQLLRHAVVLQDDLNYMEPPDWFSSSRESLGGALLASGDAAGAEKVFREELERNPRGGRSLFGLWKSLEAQGKKYDAGLVRRQFEAAWKNADTKLTAEDL